MHIIEDTNKQMVNRMREYRRGKIRAEICTLSTLNAATSEWYCRRELLSNTLSTSMHYLQQDAARVGEALTLHQQPGTSLDIIRFQGNAN